MLLARTHGRELRLRVSYILYVERMSLSLFLSPRFRSTRSQIASEPKPVTAASVEVSTRVRLDSLQSALPEAVPGFGSIVCSSR